MTSSIKKLPVQSSWDFKPASDDQKTMHEKIIVQCEDLFTKNQDFTPSKAKEYIQACIALDLPFDLRFLDRKASSEILRDQNLWPNLSLFAATSLCKKAISEDSKDTKNSRDNSSAVWLMTEAAFYGNQEALSSVSEIVLNATKTDVQTLGPAVAGLHYLKHHQISLSPSVGEMLGNLKLYSPTILSYLAFNSWDDSLAKDSLDKLLKFSPKIKDPMIFCSIASSSPFKEIALAAFTQLKTLLLTDHIKYGKRCNVLLAAMASNSSHLLQKHAKDLLQSLYEKDGEINRHLKKTYAFVEQGSQTKTSEECSSKILEEFRGVALGTTEIFLRLLETNSEIAPYYNFSYFQKLFLLKKESAKNPNVLALFCGLSFCSGSKLRRLGLEVMLRAQSEFLYYTHGQLKNQLETVLSFVPKVLIPIIFEYAHQSLFYNVSVSQLDEILIEIEKPNLKSGKREGPVIA